MPHLSARPRTAPLVSYTRDAIRRLDRLAVEEFGIPSIVLMENAAIGVANEAVRMVGRNAKSRIAVYCGPGNNGGDGLAAARHLHNAGMSVSVVLSGPAESYRGDALTNLEIVRAMGLPMEGESCPHLIVDALLGTGLDRPVEGVMASFIQRINARPRGARVLAVDIPSGLDAETGRALGVAVKADVTVTLVGLKSGFLRRESREYVGRVVVAGIGVPRELEERLGTRVRGQGVRPTARRPKTGRKSR